MHFYLWLSKSGHGRRRRKESHQDGEKEANGKSEVWVGEGPHSDASPAHWRALFATSALLPKHLPKSTLKMIIINPLSLRIPEMVGLPDWKIIVCSGKEDRAPPGLLMLLRQPARSRSSSPPSLKGSVRAPRSRHLPPCSE